MSAQPGPESYSGRTQLRTFGRFLLWMIPVWDSAVLALIVSLIMATVSVVDPWLGKYLIDDAFPNQRWGLFYGIFTAIIAMDITRRITETIGRILNKFIDVRVGLRMRIHFFQHLQRLSMTFHEDRPIGEHMYRADADIGAVMWMVTDTLPQAFYQLYSFVLILIFTVWLDWRVTVAILIYTVPYSMIAQKIGTWRRILERRSRERWQEVDAGMQEGIAGAAVVKTFGRRHHEVRRYIHKVHEAYRAVMRLVYLGIVEGHVTGWGGLLPWLKTQIIRVYFLRRVILGELSYGSVFPIFSYMNRLANPIQGLIQMFQAVRVALVPAERILQTLDVLPVVTDRPGARSLPPITGKVEFRDVSFAYEDGRPVLHDISFTVEAGRKIGIVGSSGAGKSSIANLLLRLYDPTSGSVLVDGRDLRDVRLNTYQDQVGLVLQETHLFNGTIKENILFGKPGARDVEVEDAARMAELHDFVATLDEGYGTDLREGTRLSGGQKQRIGIARAIIGSPGILILDEPTSSLDSATEERVYRTLNRVGEGRTTFIVSHRLSTVMDADEILVIAGGRIVERGTHEELVERRGTYYGMYVLYFGRREALEG